MVAHSTTKRFKSLEIVKLFLILINADKISNGCYIVVLYSADKCSILLTVSLKICPIASNHNQSGDRTTQRFKSLEIVKLFLILINDDKISNSCYIVVLYSADKCSILLTVSLKICPIASNHNQSGDRTTTHGTTTLGQLPLGQLPHNNQNIKQLLYFCGPKLFLTGP